MRTDSMNFKRVISETTTSLSSFLNKVLGVESPQVLMGPATTELIAKQNPGASEHAGPGAQLRAQGLGGVGSPPGPQAVAPAVQSAPVMALNLLQHRAPRVPSRF